MEQIADIRDHFRRIGTKQRAEGEKKYLKSELKFFGVPVPEVRKAAKLYATAHPNLTRDELLRDTAALWTDWHELRTVAIAILEQFVSLLRATDIAMAEGRIRSAEGWAHVDYLAVRIAGPLVQRYTSARKKLTRWSRDDEFWIRRASMLALVLELREDDAAFELFTGFADRMLGEKEFFIRKAIGWVLREASKASPDLVYRYLADRIDVVAGLTLREGAKNLPPAHRDRLLARYAKR